MKLNSETIAAIVSIALNAAGFFLIHAKVESAPLIITTFMSTTMMWLSLFLTIDHLRDGEKCNLDFWCWAVVMPLLLPLGLWACVLCKIYS